MAKANSFFTDGDNQDRVVDNRIQLAVTEIYATYGHKVKVHRKSLRKYGLNSNVGTGEHDVNTFNNGAYLVETIPTTNIIDTISSSDASDVGVVCYLEGMSIDGDGNLNFKSQTITLNGQNKVPLNTPLVTCSRARGVAAGVVRVYEDTAITAGVPNDLTKVHNEILVGENTSFKASTSIAKSNYFILTEWWASIGKAGGSTAVDVRLRLDNIKDAILGNSFYTEQRRSISLNSPLDNEFKPYGIIVPNTHIKITASASSGTSNTVTAGFGGYFADIVG